MTVDPELRDQLRQLGQRHEPDQDRIRARFDAGVTAVGDRATAEAGATVRAGAGRWVAVATRAAAVVLVGGLAVAGVVAVTNREPPPASVEAGGARSTGGVAPPYVQPTPPTTTVATTTPDPALTLPPGTTVGATTAESPAGSGAPDPDGGTSPAGAAPGGASAGPGPTSAPAAATGPSVPPGAGAVAELCGHNDGLALGRFYLINDLWGVDRATSGSQCVSASSAGVADGDDLAWSTSWSWKGKPGQPKSFSSVHLGWHWGWPVADSGLPRAMADRPGIRSQWDFTVALETPGRMEVAYDLWFHDRPDPGSGTLPVSEVRVILYRTPMDLPARGRLATVALEGGTWDVYRLGESWDVVTFFRTEPTTSADIDLGVFLDVAGQYVRLPWLTSIHAGVGVNDGAGRVDTGRFTVTLS